jgi:hypothetical protein
MADQPADREISLIPEPVMEVIKLLTHDKTVNAHFRMVGVLVLLEGWAYYEDFDRTAAPEDRLPRLRIGSKQWLQICEWLTSGVPTDRLDQVNLGLDFMNRGPSSVDDELLANQVSRDVDKLVKRFSADSDVD